MTAIYKYPLEITGTQAVVMPVGSYILSVQMQGQVLTAWALIDDTQLSKEIRTVVVYGTGQPLPDYFKQPHIFRATVQEGDYVWMSSR